MYANLEVHVMPADPSEDQTVYAWNVIITKKGKIKIYTDLNDGAGNYAEEGPVLTFPRGTRIDITASF